MPDNTRVVSSPCKNHCYNTSAHPPASRREELFNLINELPTCYEVVSGRAKLQHSSTPAAAAAMEQQQRKRGTEAAAGRPQQRTRMVGA
jgi:hypothetical protein